MIEDNLLVRVEIYLRLELPRMHKSIIIISRVDKMASFMYQMVPIVKVTLGDMQISNAIKSIYPDIYYSIVSA